MAQNNKTIKYVIYAIPSKRPLRQGTCQRNQFNLVVQSLDHGKERAKILNDASVELDLTPYDLFLGSPRLKVNNPLGMAMLNTSLQGKTAADAITSIDDLDTET